jgi:hypothetical protein
MVPQGPLRVQCADPSRQKQSDYRRSRPLRSRRHLNLADVPVIRLEHLTKAQAKAYMVAHNKLTDRSSWNDQGLALHLKELSDLVLDFEIEATGFEPPEIDLRIQSLDPIR